LRRNKKVKGKRGRGVVNPGVKMEKGWGHARTHAWEGKCAADAGGKRKKKKEKTLGSPSNSKS